MEKELGGDEKRSGNESIEMVVIDKDDDNPEEEKEAMGQYGAEKN